MKLEQQVCSLELSKKLKELGVKQESLFSWVDVRLNYKEKDIRYQLVFKCQKFYRDEVSAFTVAELLDLLPAGTTILKRTDITTKTIARYYVETCEQYNKDWYDENPANACAKMLIYLLENNLLTPPKE